MAKAKPQNNKYKRWDALKTDFLAGDYPTLSEFARTNPIEKLDPSSGTFKLKTKGWLQEKKGLMHKVSAEVVEHIKVQRVVQNLNLNERFQSANGAALEAIEDYLAQVQYKKKLVKKDVPRFELELDKDGNQVIDPTTGQACKKLLRDVAGDIVYDVEFVEVDAPIVDVANIKKIFEALDKGSKTNVFLDRYIRPPDIPESDPENLPDGSQYSDEELTTYQKWAKRLNR